MEEPHSETMLPPDSSVVPLPDAWGRRPTRIALFVLHVVMLAAAIALTPAGYAYQLGYYTGYVLVFGSLLLWVLLYAAKNRTSILVFCALVLAQVGFMASIGLHFRTENKALQQIMAELVQQWKGWDTQMGQFRMDPLFEMTSGERQLSREELLDIQTRARAAKTKAREQQSEATRWIVEAERRLAAVSPRGARDFQRGLNSRQAESDENMKLTQDYFTEIEQLTGFLIEREKRYRVTKEGLEFDRDEDVQAFNQKIDTLTRLGGQLNTRHRKAEEALRELPSAH